MEKHLYIVISQALIILIFLTSCTQQNNTAPTTDSTDAAITQNETITPSIEDNNETASDEAAAQESTDTKESKIISTTVELGENVTDVSDDIKSVIESFAVEYVTSIRTDLESNVQDLFTDDTTSNDMNYWLDKISYIQQKYNYYDILFYNIRLEVIIREVSETDKTAAVEFYVRQFYVDNSQINDRESALGNTYYCSLEKEDNQWKIVTMESTGMFDQYFYGKTFDVDELLDELKKD